MNLAKILFRSVLMATFAVWFGGFTFYTSIVVPIGTEVLGSGQTQGFITQQVTHWLNHVSLIAILLCLVACLVERKQRSRLKNTILGIVISLLFFTWLGLTYLHPVMDGMIEIAETDVFDNIISDPEYFYQLHRIYLWTSTIQWVFAWIWLFMTIADWTPRPVPSVGSKEQLAK